MKRIVTRILIVGAMLSLAACYHKGEPAPAPGGVAVTPGDQSATVSWTPDPGVSYWVWCAQGTSITIDNAFSLPGLKIVTDAATPTVVAGLTNGTTYSCMVNGRINGGPGGPGSASMPVLPRLAGASWAVGGPTVIGTINLHGATYGATFVAVGDAGAIFTSADGKTWTAVTPLNSNNLYAAVYGGSYVAVGQGGTILTSTDAVTWTSQSSGTGNDLNAVATTGGGYYVAIGQAGTILYSSGGTTWTASASTAAAGENLTGVAYGALSTGNYFVAVSDQGRILTSTDGGITWTSQTVAATPLYSVAWGVDTTVTPNVAKFVAVGASGAVLTSTDGTTGSAQTALGTGALRSVTFGRQFIAVGDSGNVYTSTTAGDTSWTQQTSGVTTQNLLAVTHNSSAVSAPFGYVAVGTSGTNLTAY